MKFHIIKTEIESDQDGWGYPTKFWVTAIELETQRQVVVGFEGEVPNPEDVIAKLTSQFIKDGRRNQAKREFHDMKGKVVEGFL